MGYPSLFPENNGFLFDKKSLRAYAAEFMGMFFFLFVTVATITSNVWKDFTSADVLTIAFSFGMSIMVLVYALGQYSGGHLNPAVTIGLATFGHISVVQGLLYIVFQCAGAAAGVGTVSALFPTPYTENSKYGLNQPASLFTESQAMGMELFSTALLVFVVYGTAVDKNRDNRFDALVPLPIGFTVFLAHIILIPITGCGINPARSFGSAVIQNDFTAHWVYWVGPCLGGILGAVLHHIPFQASETAEPVSAGTELEGLNPTMKPGTNGDA